MTNKTVRFHTTNLPPSCATQQAETAVDDAKTRLIRVVLMRTRRIRLAGGELGLPTSCTGPPRTCLTPAHREALDPHAGDRLAAEALQSAADQDCQPQGTEKRYMSEIRDTELKARIQGVW